MKKEKNRAIDPARVYRLVRRIPPGRVATYGDIAAALGRPGAARAVGTILRRNPDPGSVPCHRVIRADGSPGGYFGDSDSGCRLKTEILAREGACRDLGPDRRPIFRKDARVRFPSS